MDAIKGARAIALVDVYQKNTMSKPEMLKIAKGFDEKSLQLLQEKLSLKGIDAGKFQNDLREVKQNKHKPKM